MVTKELGKIESARFGLGGYQDCMIGLELSFVGESWGVCATEPMAWDPNKIKNDKHSKWTEEDRDKTFAATMRRLSDILAAAKVKHVGQLVGKPVEVTFEKMTIQSWRILTEVL